ncbi:MAG: hypothetical protein JWM96_531 [Alphaproteobacteria bacterium]|nr:hypothetical protein [Alphaproteobacteria bacterium]
MAKAPFSLSAPVDQKGFTLVELAIVLMIIGLLIGGILRGQELMENARITGTIQQVKAYAGAFVTFQDAYAARPGDMARATARLPGCTAANNCGNGDGNGIVGQPGLRNSDNINQAGTIAAPLVETSYFWKHMALAHLISGVDPSSNPLNAVWGSTAPAAKVNGGFSVFNATSQNFIIGDKGLGNVLRLQGSPLSNGIDAFPAISPLRARQLDAKMDDGLGDSGSVTGDHEWNCDPNGNYINSEEITCWMYFTME